MKTSESLRSIYSPRKAQKSSKVRAKMDSDKRLSCLSFMTKVIKKMRGEIFLFEIK